MGTDGVRVTSAGQVATSGSCSTTSLAHASSRRSTAWATTTEDGGRAQVPWSQAIAIAGNTDDDVAAVATIVDNLGFDPLMINHSQGTRLQPGHLPRR